MRVNSGTDWQSGIMGNASGNPGKYMALTENATAPAAGDTVLTGELAAASGGLIRAAATYAHTAAAASYTLTKTFTMNANDGTTRTINKMGIFETAVSGGILIFESAVPNPPVLIPSDSVAITETVNF